MRPAPTQLKLPLTGGAGPEDEVRRAGTAPENTTPAARRNGDQAPRRDSRQRAGRRKARNGEQAPRRRRRVRTGRRKARIAGPATNIAALARWGAWSCWSAHQLEGRKR